MCVLCKWQMQQVDDCSTPPLFLAHSENLVVTNNEWSPSQVSECTERTDLLIGSPDSHLLRQTPWISRLCSMARKNVFLQGWQ